ncbi:hypothetical protein [Dictyobacter kobayashii]|uniref:Uncharacterized protein n=1 Tax=Dictyobacter kobayashii TaxID=2014872 RepID=A0A402AJR4_9CHLR|nr:hypothetical protein [Dictyobacter kobayashii]GCE19357.1 hypothetical protein KDK_31570 [Dictyobacter kobayashii]
MKKIDWAITWLAPLTPEPTMIPTSDVFLQSAQMLSLVALDDSLTGLLFLCPDTLVIVAEQTLQHAADSDVGSKDSVLMALEKPISNVSLDAACQAEQDFMAFLDVEACSSL